MQRAAPVITAVASFRLSGYSLFRPSATRKLARNSVRRTNGPPIAAIAVARSPSHQQRPEGITVPTSDWAIPVRSRHRRKWRAGNPNCDAQTAFSVTASRCQKLPISGVIVPRAGLHARRTDRSPRGRPHPLPQINAMPSGGIYVECQQINFAPHHGAAAQNPLSTTAVRRFQ